MGAYVYYSYEEWGRGYIGARSRSPVGDDDYLGSYFDLTFKPTCKIILAEFDTHQEAIEAEMRLHKFFEVAKNPHFANRSHQTSAGWYYFGGGKKWTEEQKQKARGKKRSEETKRKMRESAAIRNNPASRGPAISKYIRENNARKGRQWVTNGVEQRMINPGEPIPDGWWSGRLYFKRRRRK